jgi:hypothetical protein
MAFNLDPNASSREVKKEVAPVPELEEVVVAATCKAEDASVSDRRATEIVIRKVIFETQLLVSVSSMVIIVCSVFPRVSVSIDGRLHSLSWIRCLHYCSPFSLLLFEKCFCFYVSPPHSSPFSIYKCVQAINPVLNITSTIVVHLVELILQFSLMYVFKFDKVGRVASSQTRSSRTPRKGQAKRARPRRLVS